MTENSKNDRKTVLVIALLLALITFGVFQGLLRSDFITMDDWQYVTHNPHVASGLTLRGLAWAFNAGYQSNWHPLTWMSHMLDCSLYGMKASGHHATNLLLHIANVLLLFFVLRRMTSKIWQSAFVAALFAIHPVHVESVAWVAERKDVLSALFWMLTMLAYIRYTERPTRPRYALVLLAFALGLLAKPVLVTLPFVLLLLDYWPLDRFQTSRKSKDHWKIRVKEKIPLFALAAASSVLTCLAQQRGGAVSTLETIPLGVRAANAIVSYVAYIWKMLLPRNLAIMYPHPFESIPTWQIVGSALLLAAVSAAAFMGRRRRYLWVGWLWYLGTLVPMIGFIQVGPQAMADRYTYIPLIGLFIIISWGGAELMRAAKWDKVRPSLACMILIALAIVARIQVGYWKDPYDLFVHADRVTRNNFMADCELGLILQNRNRLDEAAQYYSKALELIPNSQRSHLGLGIVFLRQGKLDEAIPHLRAAIAGDPEDSEAHFALADALFEKGNLQEAIEQYSAAIQLDSTDPRLYTGLGNVFAAQNKPDEAISAFRKVLELSPDDPIAHFKIAVLLINKGDLPDARPELERTLELRPTFSEAHYNLGIILASKGDLQGAISHFSEAVKFQPEYGQARERLAQAYYSTGDYSAAWEQVRLCRKYGFNPDSEFVKALALKLSEKP